MSIPLIKRFPGFAHSSYLCAASKRTADWVMNFRSGFALGLILGEIVLPFIAYIVLINRVR